MSRKPNIIELVPPEVPRDAREIDERIDSVNEVKWFMLKNQVHFVKVETREEGWMPFGLRVPEEIGQDVFRHPFAAAVQAGAGKLATASSFE